MFSNDNCLDKFLDSTTSSGFYPYTWWAQFAPSKIQGEKFW